MQSNLFQQLYGLLSERTSDFSYRTDIYDYHDYQDMDSYYFERDDHSTNQQNQEVLNKRWI